MITVAKNDRKNKTLLVIEYTDKTAMAEVTKVLSANNVSSKHSQAINNTDMDATRDLKLIGIKNYFKCASYIQNKID